MQSTKMFATLQMPELNQVTINDSLWSHYTKMVAETIVPYQWKILNDRIPGADPVFNNWKILDSKTDNTMEDGGQQVMESYCIKNFCIAAGELKGEHKGVIFVDTDVYKWLETVAYCLHNGSCKDFEKIADEVISLIGRAQQPDGYLNTYFTVAEPQGRWSNLVEGHELYCAGHLIEAAVAYYQATGKNELLTISRRFADLICKVFGTEEGQINGYPGHQEIELALIKLYRCTGVKRYLSCAKYFIDERGKSPNYFEAEIKKRNGKMLFPEFMDYDLKYSQAHVPVKQQHTAEGHAVRAVYMYCALADLATEYGDHELMNVCRALWESMTNRRMYITGGIGSSGFLERFTADYDLPNDSAYCETCASIGLALFGRRMWLIEQDAKYYDVVERALYNRILAGISVEGDRYFYVNPLEVWPDNCLDHTSMSHVKAQRQRWFRVACCPPNIARTLASLGQYIYATSNDTIYINLFISSSFVTDISGVRAELSMNSNILADGTITIEIEAEQDVETNLAIRIPEYADAPAFFLDGEAVKPKVDKGYALIESNIGGKHTLEVQLHVKPRWVAANLNVREDVGKTALMKGPCVYCLEETDNGDNLAAVFVQPGAPVDEGANSELPGNIQMLSYQGKKLVRTGSEQDRLYSDAQIDSKSVALKAVPYGLWGNREPGEMLVWQKVIIE